MPKTLSADTTLVIHVCPACYITYAIPERMEEEKRRDGTSFYCPNGHILSYNDSEIQQLKRELENKKKIIGQWANDFERIYDEKKAVERSLSATRGVVTKLHQRIANGVCPCCNRHFANVERHMKGQHPAWKPE